MKKRSKDTIRTTRKPKGSTARPGRAPRARGAAGSADLRDESSHDEEAFRGYDDGAPAAELVDDEDPDAASGPSPERRPSGPPGRGLLKPSPEDSPGPLAPYDALATYLREVSRYALLTMEEEHALAVRYYRDHDVDAAARLVTANLRLVVKIAFEYRRAFRNVMDLIQEGNIGLMQAVRKFDPYRGVKLSTYSAWWIRAYILRYVLNNWRLVKLGTTQAQRRLFFNLGKEKRRLEQLGIEPTHAMIAERLNVTTEETVEMDRRLSASDASLDAPVGSSTGRESDRRSLARVDMIGDERIGADEALALSEFNDTLHRKVSAFAESLAGREADVFRNRLWADQPETLQEVGDRYGMTREGIRQIEKKVLRKLREFLEKEMAEHLDFD